MNKVYEKTITLVILLMLAFLNTGIASERIAGTKVLIDPPPSFVKANQFPGYIMAATGASIVVNPIPGGPYTEVAKGFSPQRLSSRGMLLISKEITQVGDVEATLVQVSQQAYGIEFLKWMLIFGDASETILVVATFPQRYHRMLSDRLKAAVLSSQWQRNLQVDFFEGVGFRIEESGAMKIANKMGNNLFLTKNGDFPIKQQGDPIIVVGSSISQDWQVPGDKKDYSKLRFRKTKTLTDIVISNQTALQIDGLEGYIVRGIGADKRTGRSTYIEQCLLFTKDGYYILQALVAAVDQDKYRSDFSHVIQSFKRK